MKTRKNKKRQLVGILKGNVYRINKQSKKLVFKLGFDSLILHNPLRKVKFNNFYLFICEEYFG
jgi:hypothetical protein